MWIIKCLYVYVYEIRLSKCLKIFSFCEFDFWVDARMCLSICVSVRKMKLNLTQSLFYLENSELLLLKGFVYCTEICKTHNLVHLFISPIVTNDAMSEFYTIIYCIFLCLCFLVRNASRRMLLSVNNLAKRWFNSSFRHQFC